MTAVMATASWTVFNDPNIREPREKRAAGQRNRFPLRERRQGKHFYNKIGGKWEAKWFNRFKNKWFYSDNRECDVQDAPPNGITKIDEEEPGGLVILFDTLSHMPDDNVPESLKMELDLTDPTMIEYAYDIHAYLKRIEGKTINRDGLFMSNQKTINAVHRRQLLTWLYEVQHYLDMQRETLHHAAAIMDASTMLAPINCSEYQLVGLVSLYLAAKYGERYLPEVTSLSFLTKNSYSCEKILRCEQIMCKGLGFDFNMPTSTYFYETFYSKVKVIDKLDGLTLALLDFFMLHAESVEFLPSARAAVATMFAYDTLFVPDDLWKQKLLNISGFTMEELMPCFRCLEAKFNMMKNGGPWDASSPEGELKKWLTNEEPMEEN